MHHKLHSLNTTILIRMEINIIISYEMAQCTIGAIFYSWVKMI